MPKQNVRMRHTNTPITTRLAYLLLALQLLLDLATKLGQEDLSALGHAEQLRVDEVFDARHLRLGQPAQWHIPNDLQNVATAKERQTLSSTQPYRAQPSGPLTTAWMGHRCPTGPRRADADSSESIPDSSAGSSGWPPAT